MNLEELKKHKFIVIGYEHYNPLGVIRSLGENGIYPIVMILRQPIRIASRSKYIGKLHIIDSNDEAVEILLREYGNEEYKPFVIPCDDNSTETIDKNYDRLRNNFFIPNAGSSGRISEFMNKWTIMKLGEKHGLDVAPSWIAKKGEIPTDIIYPVFTKPMTSYPNWKADYYICKNEDELKKAYNKIYGNELLLQQFITKKSELTLYGVSINHGKELKILLSAEPAYVVPGYYSLKKKFQAFADEKLYTIFNKIIEEIGYEGIFDADFLIDETGKLYFLEINFRNSAFSYAATKLKLNIPLIWANSNLKGIFEENLVEIPENYVAIAEAADFSQRVKKNKMISVFAWLKDLKSVNCLLIWNKKDKKPCFSYWWGVIKLVICKKLGGRK